MRRRDPSGVVALCLSLAVHGVLVLGAVKYGGGGGVAAGKSVATRGAGEVVKWKDLEGLLEEAPKVVVPEAPKPVEEKRAEPPKVEESRVVPVVRPVAPVFVPDEIGRKDGKGTGVTDAEGEEALQARKGNQDQPLLRRNPGTGDYRPAVRQPAGPPVPSVARSAAGAAGRPAGEGKPVPQARPAPERPVEEVVKPEVKRNPDAEIAAKPQQGKVDAEGKGKAPEPNEAEERAESRKAVEGEDVAKRENMTKGGPKEVVDPPAGKVAVGKIEREDVEKRERVEEKLPAPSLKLDAIAEATVPGRVATTGPTDAKAPPDQVAVAKVEERAEKKKAVEYALAEVKPAEPEVGKGEDVRAKLQETPPPAQVADVNPRRAESDELSLRPGERADRPAAAAAPSVPPSIAGDRAPQAETESDAFSKVGAVSFKGNRVEAKFGRKVIVKERPRIDPLNEMDLFSAAATVQLRVDIDETGKVTRVDVYKSSRYPQTIDLPCVRAVYTWWIEPPKGKDGKPRADSMLWQITIR